MKAKESINEFINEEEERLKPNSTFKSEINGTSNISVWNKPWEDTTEAMLNVEWEFQIEARDWGIKGLGIHVKRVYGEFEIERYEDDDKAGDFPIEETINFETDDDWDIKTDIRVEDPFTSDIYPDEIEINWEKKEVTIIF